MWSWSTEGADGSRSDQCSALDARHPPLGDLGFLARVTCRSVLCWWYVPWKQISFSIFFFSRPRPSAGFDMKPSLRSFREEPSSPSCCRRPHPCNKCLGRPTLNLPFLAVSFCPYLNDRVRVCPDATIVSLHDRMVVEQSTGMRAPVIATLQFVMLDESSRFIFPGQWGKSLVSLVPSRVFGCSSVR